MRRRLFQRLEQRIERRRAQHVHFVDDVDLEPPVRRPVPGRLAQVTDLVDAVVGSSVDLHHVKAVAGGDFAAAVTGAARLHRGAFLAVQRLGEDTGERGLPRPARPHEDVRMGDPPGFDRVPQCAGHVLLADDILELLRAPLARQHLVRHKTPVTDSAKALTADMPILALPRRLLVQD